MCLYIVPKGLEGYVPRIHKKKKEKKIDKNKLHFHFSTLQRRKT